jgi:sigma-B regulation protein RsbU (phosphoserine phosphatase)
VSDPGQAFLGNDVVESGSNREVFSLLKGSPMTTDQASLLLVDDDDVTRDLLARYLERNGFAVTGVADGGEALALIKKEVHELVLLDILMEGMGGLEILSDVRQWYSATDLPVIMATSKDESRDIVEALKLGANDYVTKPFDFPVVLARVQTQLSLKRSVDKIRRLEQELTRQNAELEKANRRMKLDLHSAAKVQAALLPGVPPVLPTARFAWEFRPCEELAGDLLNIIPLDGGRVALYLLDVVGHGVAAALLAVMVNRVLGQLRLAGDRLVEPVEVAAHLNQEFSWDAQTCQYFTLLYGVLSLDTGEFRFVAAGHPGPVYLSVDATAKDFKLPGQPISLADGRHEEHSLMLRPGDRLYLYSDGIIEARNEHEESFGISRLLEHIERGRATSLPYNLASLLRAVQDWCGTIPPHDDISLLAVERV